MQTIKTDAKVKNVVFRRLFGRHPGIDLLFWVGVECLVYELREVRLFESIGSSVSATASCMAVFASLCASKVRESGRSPSLKVADPPVDLYAPGSKFIMTAQDGFKTL